MKAKLATRILSATLVVGTMATVAFTVYGAVGDQVYETVDVTEVVTGVGGEPLEENGTTKTQKKSTAVTVTVADGAPATVLLTTANADAPGGTTEVWEEGSEPSAAVGNEDEDGYIPAVPGVQASSVVTSSSQVTATVKRTATRTVTNADGTPKTTAVPKTDAEGNTVYKTTVLSDAASTSVSTVTKGGDGADATDPVAETVLVPVTEEYDVKETESQTTTTTTTTATTTAASAAETTTAKDPLWEEVKEIPVAREVYSFFATLGNFFKTVFNSTWALIQNMYWGFVGIFGVERPKLP